MRLTQEKYDRINRTIDYVANVWFGAHLPPKPPVNVLKLGLVTEDFLWASEYLWNQRPLLHAGTLNTWSYWLQARFTIDSETSVSAQILLAKPLPPKLGVSVESSALPSGLAKYISAVYPLGLHVTELRKNLRFVLSQCTTVQQFFYAVPQMAHFFRADFVPEIKRAPKVPGHALEKVEQERLRETLAPLMLLTDPEKMNKKGTERYHFTDTALTEKTNV